MSTNLRHRVSAFVRDRARRSVLAQYGAGLHTDCDDCATGPADVAVPAPRGRTAVEPARATQDAATR